MKARNKKTHKTTAQVFTVYDMNGEQHTFPTMKAALKYQRQQNIQPQAPRGDTNNLANKAMNEHKCRVVLSYNPGENPGYKLDKEQQRQARLFPECAL